jgi:hypothetical protein
VQAGREGLGDRTTGCGLPSGILDGSHPGLVRVILCVRRRLQVHGAPAACYRLVGATAICAKLKALSVCLPPLGRPSSASYSAMT